MDTSDHLDMAIESSENRSGGDESAYGSTANHVQRGDDQLEPVIVIQRFSATRFNFNALVHLRRSVPG
jgi:hypothetical protein